MGCLGYARGGAPAVLAHSWGMEKAREAVQDVGNGKKLTLETPAVATPRMPTPLCPLDGQSLLGQPRALLQPVSEGLCGIG